MYEETRGRYADNGEIRESIDTQGEFVYSYDGKTLIFCFTDRMWWGTGIFDFQDYTVFIDTTFKTYLKYKMVNYRIDWITNANPSGTTRRFECLSVTEL
jgi:hypothetical protein